MFGELATWLRPGLRIVSHYDADGLCATAIIASCVERPAVTILPQLTRRHVRELPDEPTLFLDVGAIHADAIAEHLSDYWILDHHKAAKQERLLNPWLLGLDGGRDACTSTLAFRVAEHFDRAPFEPAIVGMLADSQEKQGLHGLNKEVVDAAVAAGALEVEERLRLFGYERRNLVTLLVKSHDLQIPGVTENPEGARALLTELGLPHGARFHELDTAQRERLLSLRERTTRSPATARHFTLLREHGLFRDARQFATLLNACGRMERPELAVDIVRGNKAARDEGVEVLRSYRKALRDAYAWQSQADVEEGDNYRLIRAGRAILPSIIGTVCSMQTRSGDVARDTVVVGLAHQQDAMTKVSARVNDRSDRDVLAILQEALEGIESQAGGHRVAAGALLSTEDEECFLEQLRRVLRSRQT